MIICIEGITNSGKSAVCKLIETNRGIPIANNLLKNSIVSQKVKELTGPIKNINSFDAVTEMFLYSTLLSEKAFAVSTMRDDVLIDRFSLSVYAYFKAKYNNSTESLKSIITCASRGIVPDVTFFLDVSLDIIVSRSLNSPFSRKDIGLEKYYKDLRECYIDNLDCFSKKNYIINADRMTPCEVYEHIKSSLSW